MKIVVIGGTGLSGSKTSPFCASAATPPLLRPKAASTPLPARGLRRSSCYTAQR
jgi:hypothetical protein